MVLCITGEGRRLGWVSHVRFEKGGVENGVTVYWLFVLESVV